MSCMGPLLAVICMEPLLAGSELYSLKLYGTLTTPWIVFFCRGPHLTAPCTAPCTAQWVSTGSQNESLTGLHDWRVTERILPPAQDILFLNHLPAV